MTMLIPHPSACDVTYVIWLPMSTAEPVSLVPLPMTVPMSLVSPAHDGTCTLCPLGPPAHDVVTHTSSRCPCPPWFPLRMMIPAPHGTCMAQVPLPMMVPLTTSVPTLCSPAYDGTSALCPLDTRGLQLLWLVAPSCRTPTGGSPLLADNAKAYFKRAKAHAAVWNEREAREDFLRVAHLDPSMAAAVKKELKQLGERMRKKHVEDQKRYQGLFQLPRGPQASKGQESREVGDGVMLQEEARQGKVGVPETPGQGEWHAGMEEAEQGTPGAGCEGAVPGGEAAQGQAARVEVEVRDRTGLGEEGNPGTSGAEPESRGAERGIEEEGEEEEKVEEKEKEEREKEKAEEEKVEEEDEEESPAAEREKLAVGQYEAAGRTEAAGLGQGLEQGASGAERAGTRSTARAEPGRTPAPGPSSERLGPAEGPLELEDETPVEALEEGSCGEQPTGSGRGNAGEGNIPPDSFTPRTVLQAGHLEAEKELGGGAEVPPCPIAAREGGDAPPGQCSEATTLGHSQP